MRLTYELGIRLLCPSAQWPFLKAVLLAIILKIALTIVMLLMLPLTLQVTGGGTDPEPLPGMPAPAFAVVFVAPLLETILMALVYSVVTQWLGFTALVTGTLIVAGAAALHAYDVPGTLQIGMLFAALSAQYALHRETMGLLMAVLCVALTHATWNAISLLAWIV